MTVTQGTCINYPIRLNNYIFAVIFLKRRIDSEKLFALHAAHTHAHCIYVYMFSRGDRHFPIINYDICDICTGSNMPI